MVQILGLPDIYGQLLFVLKVSFERSFNQCKACPCTKTDEKDVNTARQQHLRLEKKFENNAHPQVQVEPSCTPWCSVPLVDNTQGPAHVNTAYIQITTLSFKCPCDVRHSRNKPQAATTPTLWRVSCIRTVANASAIVLLPLRKAQSKVRVTLKTKIEKLVCGREIMSMNCLHCLNKASFKANTSTGVSI